MASGKSPVGATGNPAPTARRDSLLGPLERRATLPTLGLDDFGAPLQWAAFDAADAPSALVSLSAETLAHPHVTAGDSMAITLATGSAGHVVRRAFPATDLTGFDDLTLWARSDLRIATDPDAPVRVQIKLGSAAMPTGDPTNLWHRYVSVPAADHWAYQRFALDDLAPAVRGALNSIALTITDVDNGGTLILDGLEAQSRAATGDCEAALSARLHNQVSINGTLVPVLVSPDAPVNAAEPHIVIERVKMVPNPQRALNCGTRSDHDDNGYRIRAIPEPWDLYFALDVQGASAAEAAQIHDFLINRLGDDGWLPIGNRAWRTDIVDWRTLAPDLAAADRRLLLRVGGWQDRGGSTLVRPANDVVLNIGARAAAGGTV